ncbi:hypothetical protein EV361DRAFT_931446 [Lentinula raphanica]|nr:hypothetical protein EV361DRAFT_931446 [Lentinula raphanica]
MRLTPLVHLGFILFPAAFAMPLEPRGDVLVMKPTEQFSTAFAEANDAETRKNAPNRPTQEDWFPNVKLRFLDEDGETARGSRTDRVAKRLELQCKNRAGENGYELFYAPYQVQTRVRELLSAYWYFVVDRDSGKLGLFCLNDFPFDDPAGDFTFKFTKKPGEDVWGKVLSGDGKPGILRENNERGKVIYPLPSH